MLPGVPGGGEALALPTDPGSLKPWVLFSSGPSKKLRLNSLPASNDTSGVRVSGAGALPRPALSDWSILKTSIVRGGKRRRRWCTNADCGHHSRAHRYSNRSASRSSRGRSLIATEAPGVEGSSFVYSLSVGIPGRREGNFELPAISGPAMPPLFTMFSYASVRYRRFGCGCVFMRCLDPYSIDGIQAVLRLQCFYDAGDPSIPGAWYRVCLTRSVLDESMDPVISYTPVR